MAKAQRTTMVMTTAQGAEGDGGANGGHKRPRRNDEERERAVTNLRAELARVRSRFGVDPATPIAPEPWASPSGTVEEDEAEFADALADCLSVGLPLDAAVASWISGDLARDEDEDEESIEPDPFLPRRASVHAAARPRPLLG